MAVLGLDTAALDDRQAAVPREPAAVAAADRRLYSWS